VEVEVVDTTQPQILDTKVYLADLVVAQLHI
jgi:hypothetical protein